MQKRELLTMMTCSFLEFSENKYERWRRLGLVSSHILHTSPGRKSNDSLGRPTSRRNSINNIQTEPASIFIPSSVWVHQFLEVPVDELIRQVSLSLGNFNSAGFSFNGFFGCYRIMADLLLNLVLTHSLDLSSEQ